MFNTSTQLYRQFDISDNWQQGDIIEDLYITRVIEDDMFIYRRQPEASGRISILTQIAETNNEVEAPFDNKHRREDAVIPALKTDVMILSQTCDVMHDDKLIVARVCPFRQLRERPEVQENIRRGEVMYAFYLPDYPAADEESFVDLTQLTVISKKLITNHPEKRKRSLSPDGLRRFQFFIWRYFCREAMPDDIAKIITTFQRELRHPELKDKVDRVYYDYSTEKITLLVALDNVDEQTQKYVERAKQLADGSIGHCYKLEVVCKSKDSILLRDIEGFREFRQL